MDDSTDPGARRALKPAQAGRIRAFLKRLDEDDALLVRFIKDRVGVLQAEVDGKRLKTEDMALLLEGNHSRVYEVMGEGEAIVWVVSWVVGV